MLLCTLQAPEKFHNPSTETSRSPESRFFPHPARALFATPTNQSLVLALQAQPGGQLLPHHTAGDPHTGEARVRLWTHLGGGGGGCGAVWRRAAPPQGVLSWPERARAAGMLLAGPSWLAPRGAP